MANTNDIMTFAPHGDKASIKHLSSFAHIVLECSDDEGGDVDVFMNYGEAVQLAEAILAAVPGHPETTEVNPSKPARKMRGYADFGDQARLILQHIRRAGSISAREAMNDHGITSATLARRICDLEAAGHTVIRDKRKHPITGRSYTRYSLAQVA